MSSADWDAVAQEVADRARLGLEHRPRGAVPVAVPWSEEGVAAVFGNSRELPRGRGPLTLALIRHALDEAGLRELGFGVSQDGACWAVLVAAAGPSIPLLLAFLEEAVWEGWRIAGCYS